MAPPDWALAERTLLDLNAEGVRLFAEKYVDGRGYLRGPEHWGITDGPDDSVEPIRNWPLAHALGGPDSIVKAWQTVWEGHLDQYSRAKVPEVESAKDGIYWREFTPSFDWEHIGEGLSGFYFYGLSQPDDPAYVTRLRRFAGFYIQARRTTIRSSRSSAASSTAAAGLILANPPRPIGTARRCREAIRKDGRAS